MKRRTFLKGSALSAGVALLEGCAREQVDYLVQPLRRSGLAGESDWRVGVCTQCDAGCGLRVRTVDGDAKKIEGLAAHPMSHGGVCALGQSAIQELYNPDRVLQPHRGNEATTWEEALKACAAAIGDTEPDRIALVGGAGRGFQAALLRRLAATLGAPAPTFMEPFDATVERSASHLVFGWPDAPVYDLAGADYVLSIGADFLDRWRNAVHYTWAYGELRGGRPGRRGKLLHAGPRMSLTAASADEWLPIYPGTEGVLARGLAALLAARRSSAGRGELTGLPSLEETAARCDVAAQRLLRVADELAAAEQPLVIAGGSATHGVGGLRDTAAAMSLNVLLGNVGRPGGVAAPRSLGLESSLADAAAETSIADLGERLAAGAVDTVLVCDADPLHVVPATWGWRQAFDRATIIALSAFRNDTAGVADCILPVQTQLERFNAVENRGASVAGLSLSGPVVGPEGDSRQSEDVLLALATALGHEVPWSSVSELISATAEAQSAIADPAPGDFDDQWEAALQRGGFWHASPEAAGGNAVSGEVGAPAALEEVLRPNAATPTAGPGAEGDRPFRLVLFESAKFGDGRGANRPWLQELPDTLSTVMWGSWAEIAPADAARLGVVTGDRIAVASDAGELEVGAVVTPSARPGTVAIPLGLGYEDYGRYARGRGVNPLHLLQRRTVDGCDVPALDGQSVRIQRRGAGTLAVFGRGLRDAEHIPVGWAPHEHGQEHGHEDQGEPS